MYVDVVVPVCHPNHSSRVRHSAPIIILIIIIVVILLPIIVWQRDVPLLTQVVHHGTGSDDDADLLWHQSDLSMQHMENPFPLANGHLHRTPCLLVGSSSEHS